MGYRSEWKLAILASSNQKLLAIIKWMEDYKNNQTKTQDTRNIMECILDSELNREDTTIEFGDISTKCYDPWDYVIDEILMHINADKDLDMAYSRIGEDDADSDNKYGDKGLVMLGIQRMILGPDFGEFEEDDIIINTNQNQEVCTNCGRTKDINQQCWWCGK